MMSLSKLIAAKTAKPYSQPVKVTVVEVGRSSSYKTDKGEDKQITVVGACDREHAIKLNVYDPAKVALMKEGGCVMLMNYIFKQEPDRAIVITNKSKVMQTSPMLDLNEDIRQKARELANPAPARLEGCKSAKLSPIKSHVSVQGKVISEEAVRTVKVRGADVQVKNINIQDSTDTLKVALWSDLTDSSLVGQYVKLQNVVVTSYKDEVSVSSTARTQIEDCQEPASTIDGTVVAFEEGDLTFSLMVECGENFSTYDVPSEMVSSALDEGTLAEKIPAEAQFKIEKGTVVSFKFL